MVEKASKLKISVLRRFKPEEVLKEKPVDYGELGPCEVYTDEQEFIVDLDGKRPEGFCEWAWDDLYKTVQTLRFHGNFQWFDEEGVSVACCTDGLRPVVFKVERTN
jgi:uncharacterized repeat protein (TIGR04076 family)